MDEKTYMSFNIEENKEYIYYKNYIDKQNVFENEIGKTFIDFLANSNEIIEVIQNEMDSYYKSSKLKDSDNLHTIAKFKLEEINPFFKYFDYDEYISNYLKDMRNKNNIEINTYLEKIKQLRNSIKYYKSEQYYEEAMNNEIASYHNYSSKESKEGFFYIDKAENETNKLMRKFINKYGYKPSYNSWEKIYSKNKNAIKGDNIIDEINKRIYKENEVQINKNIEKDIQNKIKIERESIKLYKKQVRKYAKENDRTLEQVFEGYINTLKFYIAFSKYTLVDFYNLRIDKSDQLSSIQRILDYLLSIKEDYSNNKIFELPKSEITFELNDYLLKNIKKIKYNKNAHGELTRCNFDVIQEYTIHSIKDFISVSLIQILQNNIKLCQCNNCGKLFISTNKSNEKYCTYEFKKNKTCRDLSYSIHLQKDELSNILRKRYRTENAKKNRNKHIPKIEEKFQIWYKKAKEQKILCEEGKISIEDFNKWFYDNSKWF